MLKLKKIFFQIEKNLDDVIKEKTPLGTDLFNLLVSQHPADIALFFDSVINEKEQLLLFKKFSHNLKTRVFNELSENSQANLLVNLGDEASSELLKTIPTETIIKLFDSLSDEDLKKYLKLLQKKQRSDIISRLNFKPDSAGRIMNSEVINLQKDFTIKKSLSILQRLGEKQELLKVVYITDQDQKLLGNITLGDLVVNKPETVLKNIIRKNVLVINVNQDQEDVANQFSHYGLLSAPVVDNENNFLGVITADDVIEVLEEEASEDVYKMSGLSPSEDEYLQTPLWKFVWQRTPWLVGLLLLQSISSFILSGYNYVVDKYFIIPMFLTMLIGTGGNAGNQSSAIIIRGLATGQISRKDGLRVLLREFGVSIFVSLILVVVAFTRVFLFKQDLMSAFAVAIALFFIIMVSMILGTVLPLLLERFNLDPAHSAAPFLATLMDILGVTIYCFVVSRILG
ncbi:magnesium transporter [Candidatus Dependentiae bacterium]|nr:magnesium transporter [Candidatus Dependentiae bacterium]MBU4386906.1 magnesium transporter [Candidatus Dependentiae bacterium]MCG2756382.1 magnesium transporter [Candidatus Dependentiae bacterium]